MEYSSYPEYRKQLEEGVYNLPSVVDAFISRIDANKHLNAFLEVFETEAREQARVIQSKIESGTAGKLAGMVIGLKDNICFANHKVSASSKILEGFSSLYSATAVERLLSEDAIIIGRLNCDEFAMGSSNENSAFGPVLNPLNTSCVPGGSSGGSASAVAANLCHAALGSDTGGSIRQPASFTGTVGFKPSYGRVSRHGLIAYGSSFDQIGPICHSVSDAELLMSVISGPDEFDGTASQKHWSDLAPLSSDKLSSVKFAYIKEALYSEGIDPEISKAFIKTIETLKSRGYLVEELALEELPYLVPTYYVLTTAEASSNLSRFDGMRYGYRSPDGQGVENTITKSRSEGFGKEVKRRIMLGTFVLSAGYYDAYYSKAQKVRRKIQDKTKAFFKHYDFIITPTTPGVAFPMGQKSADPIKMYLEDIFTVQANITGMPAISIPMGFNQQKLPFGLQIMADYDEDMRLMHIAKSISSFI